MGKLDFASFLHCTIMMTQIFCTKQRRCNKRVCMYNITSSCKSYAYYATICTERCVFYVCMYVCIMLFHVFSIVLSPPPFLPLSLAFSISLYLSLSLSLSLSLALSLYHSLSLSLSLSIYLSLFSLFLFVFLFLYVKMIIIIIIIMIKIIKSSSGKVIEMNV